MNAQTDDGGPAEEQPDASDQKIHSKGISRREYERLTGPAARRSGQAAALDHAPEDAAS